MRYASLLIVGSLFPFLLRANNENEIISLINRWNNIHNTHNTGELLSLYAPEVLFYGQPLSASECYWKKENFFLHTDFKQEIISSVVITHYSSGIIKADFTKRTISGKKIKEHFCYLLFKNIDGQYRITGESDSITDKNKNIVLNLGEIDSGNNSSAGTISFLLLLTAGGCALYRYHRKRSKNIFEEDSSSSPVKQRLKEQIWYFNRDTHYTSPEPVKNPEKGKGDLFESFVVERFDKKYFKLLDWRSDKYHKGIYAMSNMMPDLVYRYKSNSMEAVFAVECKWRSQFNGGEIIWAKDYQLDNYNKFAAKRNIKVFVIIGVGGSPDKPRSLYIIPLDEICSLQLYEIDIKKYYRYGKGNFFFDAQQFLLK